MQRDNAGLRRKVDIRMTVLAELKPTAVMETHGGIGRIWQQCYRDIAAGVVFEKDPNKSVVLAKQRPGWSVYECDSAPAIAAGAGAHVSIDLLDLDPYGDPWPVVDAFFMSKRPRPARMAVVVNDGLRQGLKMGRGWNIETMREAIGRFGNQALYSEYLEVARWNLARIAAKCGYVIERWAGYYTGHADQMTHYGAVLSLKL